MNVKNYIETLTPFGCLYMFYGNAIGGLTLNTTQIIISSFILLIWIALLCAFSIFSIKAIRK
ncbi:hypothetical protein [Spiroplasma floricola]|uniref:hypothetical protein n=1 Tax=Spiroplasma floricola TaxID=216937 RepID=UPI000C2D2D10|nr:hypothetical protein [Spiroplasma floricola]